MLGVITILLSLAGFGVQADPKPPTAAALTRYAPADADFAAMIDLAALVPGNYRALNELATKPELKDTPAAEPLAQVVAKVEQGRTWVKDKLGIDPISDVQWAVAWVQVVPGGMPNALIEVHGKWPADLLDRVTALSQGMAQASEVDGAKLLSIGPGSVAVTRDGDLLIGSADLVSARLKKAWKPAAAKADSNLALARTALGEKPIFAVLSMPSVATKQFLVGQIPGGTNALTDAINGHRFASLALRTNGISWIWASTDEAGWKRAKTASAGIIELMRAGDYAARGLGKLALASLDSYKGKSAELDLLIAHEDELYALLESLTGDGTFTATIDAQKATHIVSVKATGKKLSDVVPALAILPVIGGFATFGLRHKKADEVYGPVVLHRDGDQAGAAPVAVPTSGVVDVQAIYRRVKAAHTTPTPTPTP